MKEMLFNLVLKIIFWLVMFPIMFIVVAIWGLFIYANPFISEKIKRKL
jgi:hypothetical protein